MTIKTDVKKYMKQKKETKAKHREGEVGGGRCYVTDYLQ